MTIQLFLKDKETGCDVGCVELPAFCLSHMQSVGPLENLNFLLQHVNKKVCPKKCSKLYINGKDCYEGIRSEDVANGCTIELSFF